MADWTAFIGPALSIAATAVGYGALKQQAKDTTDQVVGIKARLDTLPSKDRVDAIAAEVRELEVEMKEARDALKAIPSIAEQIRSSGELTRVQFENLHHRFSDLKRAFEASPRAASRRGLAD